MDIIEENFNKIKDSLKEYPNIRIITELNTYNVEDTKKIVSCGIVDVCDNRRESFMEKYNALKKNTNIVWHFFGTLTTFSSMNTQFIDAIDYLHSLESIDVAAVINRVRSKEEPLKCLIKVDVCDNKGPITPLKVVNFVKQLKRFENIQIVGLTTIVKNTYDEELINSWYSKLKEVQSKVQALELDYAPCTELSMGTNNDYMIASKCGSTMIHIGRIL